MIEENTGNTGGVEPLNLGNSGGILVETEVLAYVRRELENARRKHPTPMRSVHEGYGILKEEVDEMWDDIKVNNLEGARKEAIQVAAMAIRFVIDSQSFPR